MASLRHQRRRACQRKVAHATEARARAAALDMDARHPTTTPIGWFTCRFCGHWHIGHDPARVRAFVAAARRTA